MQQNTDKNQDTLYQDRLRRSQMVLEMVKSGVWEQIHGTVLNRENSQPNRQNTSNTQPKVTK